MIDLEKLRESAELFKSKDLQMGVNPEALLELLNHIAKLEASETKLITERDHCEEVIDRMADAVLGPDRHEWTSAYDIDDAAEEVEQRAAQLEKVAGRYKWLRQSPSPACDIAMAKHFSCGRGEDFESLIDTAMEG